MSRQLTAVRKESTEFQSSSQSARCETARKSSSPASRATSPSASPTNPSPVRSREQAANLAKSQFLGTMSHEVRTPMNSMLGMANLSPSTTRNDRPRRLLEKVTRLGQALLGIINDILKRDLPAAIDSLNPLIGDVHVPA